MLLLVPGAVVPLVLVLGLSAAQLAPVAFFNACHNRRVQPAAGYRTAASCERRRGRAHPSSRIYLLPGPGPARSIRRR